jgi:3-hydroxybutyryl-CoA dehydratase
MPEPATKDFFEDCQVGERVATSGRTVTEADLVLFAAHTGDWLPPHTNAEYAQHTLFGERIAHGMLVLAIGSALLLRLGESAFLPRSSLAVYELERVRFHAPTKVGDTLHLESEVRAMQALDKRRGLLTIHNVIANQRRDTVVSFTAKVLVGRRPHREEPGGGEAAMGGA